MDFNRKELEYLNETRFFDQKITISQKVISLLSGIESKSKEIISASGFNFPPRSYLKSGKISRGENYQNYPYFVLDYPRLFSKEDIFAFRTILWWGHHTSNNFILAGKSLEKYRSKLIGRSDRLMDHDWKICKDQTPWRLEDLEDVFLDCSQIQQKQITEILHKHPFIKLTQHHNIYEIDKLEERSINFLQQILDLLE